MKIFTFGKKGGDPNSTRDNELLKSEFQHISAGQPIKVENIGDTITNGYLKSDTVFSVVNKIVSLGNGVKWDLYEVQDKEAFKQLKAMQRSKDADFKQYVKTHQKALKKVDVNATIEAIIERPNKYQSMPSFWEAWASYYLITGNTYVYGLRRIAGKDNQPFISLHISHPANTQLILSDNFAAPVKGYKFSYAGKEVPETEVWHTKTFNPSANEQWPELIGKSPLEVISNLVSVDIEGVSNQALKFANDGVRGILTGAGADAMLQNVGENAANRIEKLKQDYYRQMASKSNGLWGKVKDILFYPFLLQWLNIGQTAVEMDTVSTLTEVKKRIYAAYNVPFQDDPKYSNANVWRKDAIIGGLFPVLEKFKEMLNMFVLKSYAAELGNGYYIDFDMVASFPELQDDLSAIITAVNGANFMSTDDKRIAAGMAPLDTDISKQVLVPYGLVPLDDIGNTNADNTEL